MHEDFNFDKVAGCWNKGFYFIAMLEMEMVVLQPWRKEVKEKTEKDSHVFLLPSEQSK